ncbi:MFS transporter [Paroceanicella profunda]|uniref:MFS transporter n=1 Tax=Paroceanicella profunda TaxID=2579971 RepID=A0A5B8FGB9_9RHOB|nr:MFS transporter [Paroceanicella profunda]QDL90971.1 MFS transporter [Paroceanicella profunda]
MTDRRASLFTPVLLGGTLIIVVTFGIRASFGVFQIPIATEFGWPRADFSLAIAIQNLAWGIGSPIFGAMAERVGDRKAILLGALVYILGLLFSTMASSPLAHQGLEFLVGMGIAGTGLGVILAVVGRASSDEHRSMSLAIVTAAGSAGQMFGPPSAQLLLGLMDWRGVFLVFALAVAVVMLALPLMKVPERPGKAELAESMGTILARSFRDPSYTLIFLGFFSCGFQLAFITAHFPAFVTEMCGPIAAGGLLDGIGISSTSALGAFSIAVIGACNVVGTLVAGWLGRYYPRKYLLAIIYVLRTLIAIAFILLPMTPFTVLAFSAGMGLLWLATVPLTSGLVAHLYGLRYMATLYGVIFLSHQIGGFLGVWLGGTLYDRYGSYDVVWWVGIGVGAFSAIVHLPVRERPLLAPAAA